MGIWLYMVKVRLGNVPLSPNANQQCGHFSRLDLDLAEWLERRLTANAEVATVPGFEPGILRHKESEGRQMKPC
jgi:hypothetical protein